jgi:hypothetical protein
VQTIQGNGPTETGGRGTGGPYGGRARAHKHVAVVEPPSEIEEPVEVTEEEVAMAASSYKARKLSRHTRGNLPFPKDMEVNIWEACNAASRIFGTPVEKLVLHLQNLPQCERTIHAIEELVRSRGDYESKKFAWEAATYAFWPKDEQGNVDIVAPKVEPHTTSTVEELPDEEEDDSNPRQGCKFIEDQTNPFSLSMYPDQLPHGMKGTLDRFLQTFTPEYTDNLSTVYLIGQGSRTLQRFEFGAPEEFVPRRLAIRFTTCNTSYKNRPVYTKVVRNAEGEKTQLYYYFDYKPNH